MIARTILDSTWMVVTALVVVMIVIMILRGVDRSFPWLIRYLVVVAARGPSLYSVRITDDLMYFYCYWAVEAITVALTFPVIYEVYHYVAGTSRLRISRSTFFALCVAFFALSAIITALNDPKAAQAPLLIQAIFALTNSIRTIQVGLLIVLLIGSMFYNFYWQSLPFGIALGYGIYALIELIAVQLRPTMGTSGNLMFQLAKVLGYQLAVILWIVFLLRHREGHALDELPKESAAEWLPVAERSIP